jgi:hypothetical protein
MKTLDGILYVQTVYGWMPFSTWFAYITRTRET